MNELESKIFDEIIGRLSGTYGYFELEVEVGNIVVDITGSYEWEYSRDTDYYSGTGEYTTTYASIGIDCNIHEYTADGDELPQSNVDIDVKNIISYVEDYMYNY